MYSTTRPLKMYGRKHSVKDKDDTSLSSSRPASFGGEDDERPRKRRTISASPSCVSDGSTPAERMKQHSPNPNERRDSNDEIEQPLSKQPSTSKTTMNTATVPPSFDRIDKGKRLVRQTYRTPTGKDYSEPFQDEESAKEVRQRGSAIQLEATTPLTTPRKAPRDLADIFEAVSPFSRSQSQRSSNQSTPKGMTKNMLSRSRTEPSLDTSPLRTQSQENTRKSYSFAESSSASSTSRTADMRIKEYGQHSPVSFPKLQMSEQSDMHPKEVKNIRRTYAGQSRSFLVALPASSYLPRRGAKEDDPEGEEDYLRDSYTELRKRWGVDNSEDHEQRTQNDDEDSTTTGEGLHNPLFSITDLRSKGETRRFLDEIGYLFEGLAPDGNLGVRRSAALDILSNLRDQEFWRKARAAGLFAEIWNQLRAAGAGDGDKILDGVLSSFASYTSVDARDLSVLAKNGDFVDTMAGLLSLHQRTDPFLMPDAAGFGHGTPLTNSERMMLRRLHDIVTRKPDDERGSTTLPCLRLQVSNVLSALPSNSFTHAAVILVSLINDLGFITTRLSAHKSGLPLFQGPISDSSYHYCLSHIHNCLVILDAYLLDAQDISGSQDAHYVNLKKEYESLSSRLVALITVARIIERSPDLYSLSLQASPCIELAFRVLINLTNDSREWTDLVVSDEYALPMIIECIMASHRDMSRISGKKAATNGEEIFTKSMDRLCLALALFTNLAQERKDLSTMLQETRISDTCKLSGACLNGCVCEEGSDALIELANIYIALLKIDDEMVHVEADLHFLRGHIAVLLGLLALEDPIRSIVEYLPGSSSRRKLDDLITNIADFAALFTTIVEKASRKERASSEAAQENVNLPHNDNSHSPGNERMSVSIITDVIASLKALRNEL